MTGQDAVNVADTFNQRLKLDGAIMTKLDGDARGGAALSVKEITGKPIVSAWASPSTLRSSASRPRVAHPRDGRDIVGPKDP